MSPKESGQIIAKLTEDITIDYEAVGYISQKIYNEIVMEKLCPSEFSNHECHPDPNDEAVDWIFIVDTLNFCFWLPNNEQWEVLWHGKVYTGYFGLCAAINRALEEGIKLTDPNVCLNLTQKDLEYILRSSNSTQLMLMKERLHCLHEVSRVLQEKYQGTFVNCIKVSEKSAQKLLNLIISNFVCFRDESEYCGVRVSFYKRAQILIGDIWSCFKGQGLGEFNDIDTITMFADYRVPQVLVHFGVLRYSESLYNRLLSDEPLQNGCKEEAEIRGCSIEAVERIKDSVLQLFKNNNVSVVCNSILIDHFLWTYRRENREDLDKVPFHKVISIYY